MAPTPSLKVTKSFTYEGTTRLWSNRYHFNGGVPADSAAWTTFADLVVADEAPIYQSDVTIVQVDGYVAGSDVPVFTKAYTTVGTGSFFAGVTVPGDCCAIERYSTTAKTSKNHPIYLFNYFHGVKGTSTGAADDVNGAQLTAYDEYGTDWIAGYSDGVNTYVRAGPNGATAISRITKPYIRHRDFKV